MTPTAGGNARHKTSPTTVSVIDPAISDSYDYAVHSVTTDVQQLGASLPPRSKTSTVAAEKTAKVGLAVSNAPGGGARLEEDADSSKGKVEVESPNDHRQVEATKWKLVPALIVIGGMDTTGYLHSDTFVYVPKVFI